MSKELRDCIRCLDALYCAAKVKTVVYNHSMVLRIDQRHTHHVSATVVKKQDELLVARRFNRNNGLLARLVSED
jgi:hypothetical protein